MTPLCLLCFGLDAVLPNFEFAFDTHVYDACQLLGKLRPFLCFASGREAQSASFSALAFVHYRMYGSPHLE